MSVTIEVLPSASPAAPLPVTGAGFELLVAVALLLIALGALLICAIQRLEPARA